MIRSIPPTLRAGTPDLPAVPRWMQVWIILFLGPILTWAETRIYRLLLPRSADRPLSAAPLAASKDRHKRRHATTPKSCAQVRGRASGVRCKALLGRRPHCQTICVNRWREERLRRNTDTGCTQEQGKAHQEAKK